MALITKAQAVTLLAEVFNEERNDGEADLQLVQRIRNGMRDRVLKRVDDQLKERAIKQYYINNPDDEETVEDLD